MDNATPPFTLTFNQPQEEVRAGDVIEATDEATGETTRHVVTEQEATTGGAVMPAMEPGRSYKVRIQHSIPGPAPKSQKLTLQTSAGDDVTEAVQVLYDIAHSSMDWGSGFLDNEEVETVIRLAIVMGWQVPNLPENSPPMVSVARQFPDHYEVKERRFPPTKHYPEGLSRPYIEVKSPA